MAYKNILGTIGNTPLVRLNHIPGSENVNMLAKIEFFNPAGSVKDRAAFSMITQAEKHGLINENTVFIEPTSGNTGIGLAMVCAVKNYKLILVMPENMSIERRRIMESYGAEIILTSGSGGMKEAISKAEELIKKNRGWIMPMQFKNKANPEIHRKTTGPEIWEQTGGEIDLFVACSGTGGTITGTSEVLKKYNPEIKVIAVEPAASPVLSGGTPGEHNIPGTGPGFIPEILNKHIIDEIISIEDNEALLMSKLTAKKEGILCGISSGAAIQAASILAQRPENKHKTIVTLLPDSGERYLSQQ